MFLIGDQYSQPISQKEVSPMLRKARIVSMIVLAASIAVTAGLAVENLVLAVIALARKRERR